MAQPKDTAPSGDKGGMRIDPALVGALAPHHRDPEVPEIEGKDGGRGRKVGPRPSGPAPGARISGLIASMYQSQRSRQMQS